MLAFLTTPQYYIPESFHIIVRFFVYQFTFSPVSCVTKGLQALYAIIGWRSADNYVGPHSDPC